MSVLSHPRFHDEAEAFKWVEGIMWPKGPVCPFCGHAGKHYDLTTRPGVRKCGHKECRKQFTVRVGTIFESSHIPMTKWLQAIHLLCSSKKGFSSHQLHRTLEVTYKTAWFLSHRIREAMRTGELAPMGGPSGSGIVEADETFIGRKKGVPKPKGGYSHKNAVLSLVERGGKVRSVHVQDVTARTLLPIVNGNIVKEARVMTDAASTYYEKIEAASHEAVNHAAGEYVRGDVHTNTVEGYFSIFKRGMKGTYQHCGEKHLHRYLAEFDFRYNARSALGVEDEARALKAIKGAKGKRLTYRPSDRA